MARQDQIDILVNQATTAIVCCYLEHMNTAINKGIPGATGASDATQPPYNQASVGFINRAELATLINNVQTALQLVP